MLVYWNGRRIDQSELDIVIILKLKIDRLKAVFLYIGLACYHRSSSSLNIMGK